MADEKVLCLEPEPEPGYEWEPGRDPAGDGRRRAPMTPEERVAEFMEGRAWFWEPPKKGAAASSGLALRRPSKKTVEEVWLGSYPSTHSAKTIQSYRSEFREWLRWLKERGYAPFGVTSCEVEEYRAWLSPKRDGNGDVVPKKAGEGKELGAASVRHKVSTVRSFYGWAHGRFGVANPTEGVKLERVRKSTFKSTLDLDEAAMLLAAPARRLKSREGSGENSWQRRASKRKAVRDRAILELMLRLGLREVEICRLRFEDVVHTQGADRVMVQGKGRDEKDRVPMLLPAECKKALDEWEKTRPYHRPTDALFTSVAVNSKREPLLPGSVSTLVTGYLRQIGVKGPRLTPHSLRHTAITNVLLAGGTLQEACDFARHADIDTTMIYLHNLNRIKAAGEMRVAGYMKGVGKAVEEILSDLKDAHARPRAAEGAFASAVYPSSALPDVSEGPVELESGTGEPVVVMSRAEFEELMARAGRP